MDKAMLERALHYCEDLLGDMDWRVQISDLDGFDTEEELQKYVSDLKDFVKELKEVSDAEG